MRLQRADDNDTMDNDWQMDYNVDELGVELAITF